MESDRIISKRLTIEFEALIKSFETKMPLRPMDLFNLTLSSGLNAFSILITYVVIMLQFKIGEI